MYPTQALNLDTNILAGSFQIAASGGAATRVSGRGYSVAKSATGEYTLTFEDPWNQLISATFAIEASTPVDIVAQLDNHTIGSATVPVMVINLNAAATPVEPAAITRVHFFLLLSNTSVPQ